MQNTPIFQWSLPFADCLVGTLQVQTITELHETLSPISLPGNKSGDKAVKHALDLPITEMTIRSEDYKLHMKYSIDRPWQRKCVGAQKNVGQSGSIAWRSLM